MVNIVSKVEKTILRKHNADALKDLGLSFKKKKIVMGLSIHL